MEDFILRELEVYGPFAVFLLLMVSGIGIPLGEDLIIIPAGVLMGHGELAWPSTLACAYAGVVAADFLWFGICHRYGTPLLHKRWLKRFLHPRRLLEAKHQIEKRGAWVIVIARFIPGSRTPAITMAGMLHMPMWKFALAECPAALVTVPAQLGLGMLIARGMDGQDTARLVQTLIGTVMLILLVMVVLAVFRQYRARRARFPRAKAAWLRRFRRRTSS